MNNNIVIKSNCLSFTDKENCNGYKIHGKCACNWCVQQASLYIKNKIV